MRGAWPDARRRAGRAAHAGGALSPGDGMCRPGCFRIVGEGAIPSAVVQEPFAASSHTPPRQAAVTSADLPRSNRFAVRRAAAAASPSETFPGSSRLRRASHVCPHRRRRDLPSHSAAGSSGSNTSDHHGDGRRGDRGSATTACASELDDAAAQACAEAVGEAVLDGPAQPTAPGSDERPPVPVDSGELGAPPRQLPVLGVADGVALGVPVADGDALARVLPAADAAPDGPDDIRGVPAGCGAVVVLTGFGRPPDPPRTRFELPLLWYPSVARIM